eukprot:TRINITY_DN4958_c0_g1_i1.p1 TRINITY_DN4958_c0_g1~~TRINITY_DN4958_c0_g1_i1.p1  ORF type:complete len:458 (-),score=108.83 TRINITY_DN4958_c0_g1_i1:28-1401(-)
MKILIFLLILVCVCLANENDKFIERVVGGANASPGQFPFQVAIYNLQESTLCGGSIIASQYILTAAHCVRDISSGSKNEDTDPSRLQVISTNDISQSSNTDQTRSGATLYIHSTYSFDVTFLRRVDMAIIKVNTPFNFGSGTTAGIISFNADVSDEAAGQTAIVSGFGTTVSNSQGNSQIASILQYVSVPIVDYATCSSKAAANGLGAAPFATVCAGGDQGKDSCAGDSGGPLFITKNGAPLQIGVVSTGTQTSNPLCAVAGQYGIYASVAKNIDWINTVLGLQGNQTASNVTVSTASPNPPPNVFEGTWTIGDNSCDPNSCPCCFTGSIKISSKLGFYYVVFTSVKGTSCSSSFIDSLIGINRALFLQSNVPYATFQYSGQIYVISIDGKNMTIAQGSAACSNPDPLQCSTSTGNCNIHTLACTGGACSPSNKMRFDFMLLFTVIAFIFTIFYRSF